MEQPFTDLFTITLNGKVKALFGYKHLLFVAMACGIKSVLGAVSNSNYGTTFYKFVYNYFKCLMPSVVRPMLLAKSKLVVFP